MNNHKVNENKITEITKKVDSIKEVFLTGISNFEETKQDFENVVLEIGNIFDEIKKDGGDVLFDRFQFLPKEGDTKADLNLKISNLIEFLDLNNNIELKKYIHGMAAFIGVQDDEDFDPFDVI